MYYFDQAATSLKKPKVVADAVYEALTSDTIGNPGRGGHRASIAGSRIVYETRIAIAELLGATHYDVVLTKNVTEALNVAIKGVFQPVDHVITTILEHNSVLRPLYELEADGMELDFVDCKPGTGTLMYDQFETLLRPETQAVVMTHASNVTGEVVDLKRVSDFCQKHGLLLIVDGAQTTGLIDINLDELGVDIFCFTGHKSLYGPQGTGGMCVKKGVEVRSFLSGGSGANTFSKEQPQQMPERLEAGTPNAHSLAGLRAGIQYVMEQNPAKLFNHVHQLTTTFYEAVSQMEHVHVYSEKPNLHSGVVALNVKGLDSAEVSEWLDEEHDVFVRSGSHCAPLLHEHFGTKDQGMVRFSFSSFNTVEEVEYAIKALKELSNHGQSRSI